MIKLLQLDKKPYRGLLAFEWAVLAYLTFTLVLISFGYLKIDSPSAMLWGRFRVVSIMAAMWIVYRLVPCRATLFLRVAAQMALLAWWYPDTYELNKIFPNLDHIVASWDEQLFGCQPALLFSKYVTWNVASELIHLGYFSYYPMIVFTLVCYFFYRYEEFLRCAFIIMSAFFIYYTVFVLFPVVGPTFYYKAIGLQEAASGHFPELGHYFNTHTDCLTLPGWKQGIFYRLVADAQASGERPTAAFPSSHVGISTICLLLIYRLHKHKFMLFLIPLYLLLCMATVYIRAHYLVDVLAGWISAAIIYLLLLSISFNFTNFAPSKRKSR